MLKTAAGIPAARFLVSLICAACCSACATRSAIPDEKARLPAAFGLSTPGATASWPTAEWYQGFGSDELSRLIAEAERNNPDVDAAKARIRQADARARAAGASLLPQLGAAGSLNRFSGGAHGENTHETDWSALLSASYEVDFWGKNSATARSASLQAQASRADCDSLAATLITGVASTYFQVLSLRERLLFAQANLDAARGMLQVIDARHAAGVVGDAELALQKAAVANAQLIVPQLQQQELEARGALALLLGRNPEGFEVTGRRLDDLAEPEVTPGLPSELLARRPDIYAAEANLRAAHADLDAARAALFPSLTLTANGGIQNPAVQAAVTTITGTGHSLDLGISLIQAIFDGGQRRAVREEADAKAQELLAAYRSAILAALLDVENSLAALHYLGLQRQWQKEFVDQSELAFEGAQARYREGAGDYLTVLESQRALSDAREQLTQYRLARLQAVVGLNKALGGGWQQP